MKHRTKLLLIFSLIPLVSLGQMDQETNINRSGGSFSLGTEFAQDEHLLYFNASGEGRGSQLYRYDGDRHLRLTSFHDSYLDPEIKEKHQSPYPLGAITSHYALFAGKLFFFARGEMTPAGLYYYEKGIVERVYQCPQISDVHCELNDRLIIEVELDDSHRIGDESPDDSVGRRVALMQVSKDAKLSLFGRGQTHYESAFADAMVSFDGEVLLSKSGVMYSTKGSKVYPDKRFRKYKNVRELILMDDRLYFGAEGPDGSGLYSVDKNSTIRKVADVIPNQKCVSATAPVILDHSIVYTAVIEDRLCICRFKPGEGLSIVQDLVFPDAGYHVQSMVALENQLFAVLRPVGEFSFALYQINSDTVMQISDRGIYDLRDLMYFKQHLYFTAVGNNDGRELYSMEPKMPPQLHNQYFKIREYNKSGFKIGQIEVLNEDQRSLKYEIVSGNEDDIFEVATYTGVLSIDKSHKIDTDVKKSYDLKIKVSNKEMSSYMQATVDIRPTVAFNFDGLQEKLLFFPDFSRKGFLTTQSIPDGTTVYIYTIEQEIIDQVKVTNGSIELGSYPTGIYILNVKGENNFYQRIEMQ